MHITSTPHQPRIVSRLATYKQTVLWWVAGIELDQAPKMSYALKLALVILIIHFKLHGLNAATIIYRYKTFINDIDSSSDNNHNSSNNDSNLSKNNYMLFNGSNNNSNGIFAETIMNATITIPTTTNTTYDWQMSDKYLSLSHATNSSNNVNNNNNNNTLSVEQTKLLCDNDGEYGSNSCGNGRDVLSDDNNLQDSYKHETSNVKQLSNIDNSNNEILNATLWQLVTAASAGVKQKITTNNTNSQQSSQRLTSKAQNYYQYDLITDDANNTTERNLFEHEQAALPGSVTIDFLENQKFDLATSTDFEYKVTTTELPPTDESFEHTMLYGLFRGWDDIVTNHDLEAVLRRYKSEMNNACIMDGVKDLVQWWTFKNGSLNFELLQAQSK